MLREVGLALSCLVAIAVPAQANDGGPAVDSSLVAAHQGATAAATRVATQERVGPVQGTIVPTPQPHLRAGTLGGFRREVGDQAAGSAALLLQRSQRRASAAFSWLSHGRSGVALPLTERLLLGLGYRHVQGEDLWPEFADTGAVDYESHHVMIRARWRF